MSNFFPNVHCFVCLLLSRQGFLKCLTKRIIYFERIIDDHAICYRILLCNISHRRISKFQTSTQIRCVMINLETATIDEI